jgi:hypothetical protein
MLSADRPKLTLHRVGISVWKYLVIFMQCALSNKYEVTNCQGFLVGVVQIMVFVGFYILQYQNFWRRFWRLCSL